MSKTKTAPLQEVDLTYDLFDLPTAQHKAGLAGLILQIRSMSKRKLLNEAELIVQLTPTSATLRLNATTARELFNDLYASKWVEIELKSKWAGDAPKEIREVEEEDPETKKKKTVRRFVYDVVHPTGTFLRDHLPEMDPSKDWLKLWRDMLWAIPRGIPLSRLPFQQRADGEDCKEGTAVWSDLLKVAKTRQENSFHTAPVASSLWLGAQAFNAESVPFMGRAEQNLLLHFWPLTVLIFAPQQVNNDGETDFVGYVLAIPEVSDLEQFCEDYPEMLHNLGKEIRGYRPAGAVIDLPAQGALAFLEHLARLTAYAAEREKFRYSVSSVEYLHLLKQGNIIRSMSAGRIAPALELVEGYRAIVGTVAKPSPYRNPLFRRGLLQSLLDRREWYQCFSSILRELPASFFVHCEDTPRTMPWFFVDAREKFRQESESHQKTLEAYETMSASDPSKPGPKPGTPLVDLINRLIRTYLNEKAKDKSGIDPEESREGDKINWENVPPAFSESKRKLAEGVFLEFRSRRDQAFVDHFVATFCSVKQYLSEQDYRTVANALMLNTEDLKTLTLLALSANS